MNELVEQRGAVYGHWRPNMVGTSQQIAGLLTQMLANGQMRIEQDRHGGKVELADCAAPLIMAAVKLNRAASGVPLRDHGEDTQNYMEFARLMQGGDDE